MLGAACVAVLVSAVTLALLGLNEHGLDAALILTGRWGFLLFWPAYAGSGVYALCGGHFGIFKRYSREFGLSFAAAMLVHVGLIVLLCVIGAAPGVGLFVFFGLGILFTYTLALLSLAAWQRRIGRRSWWFLRTVALNYIAYAFATDFLPGLATHGLKHLVLYAPFALLSVLGFAAHASSQMLSTRKRLMAT
jgi:hypothetical protein